MQVPAKGMFPDCCPNVYIRLETSTVLPEELIQNHNFGRVSLHVENFLRESVSTLYSRFLHSDALSDVYFLDVTIVNPCCVPVKG